MGTHSSYELGCLSRTGCRGLTHTHWAFKKPALGWSRYRDANRVPTSPLADDIATAPEYNVIISLHYWKKLHDSKI